jgi:hypothetical protein
MSLHWGWVWCGDLRAGLNQKLSDSLRLARRCVKCVMAQCSACPHEMGCGARVSEAQHFRCRAVHSKASKAARQAGTTDSGDCTSVETSGFGQSVRRSRAVEDSSISVPLESHHLTWEWEGEGEGCGSASFGAVAAIGRKQKGRTICSRIKQRAARRDHSPSPTSAQTSPEHHS